MAEFEEIAGRAALIQLDEPDALLRLAAIGDELRALADGPGASEVADVLAEALNSLGTSQVFPATESAGRLVDLVKHRIELGDGGPVLLDWVAVTGTSLLCAQRALEPARARRAVVLAAAADVEEHLGGLELIVAARQVARR